MWKLQWKRFLRLFLFALVVTLVMIDAAMSWVYVQALTRPGCGPKPETIPGAPAAEEIYLATRDGLQLRAWYYPADNTAAVIALGGTGGSLGGYLPLAKPLIEAGYGVLQIDSRACSNPPSAVTLGYEEAYDALAGLDYLNTRPEVAPNRIGVLGFSMGGVAAIRAGARSPEIAAVVAEGGYYNLGGDMIEAGRSQPFTRRVFLFSIAGMFWAQTGINPWSSSPIDDLPRLSPRPVLLIFGEDEAEAGRAADQFAAALDPKELWIVPGGYHGGNQLAAPNEYPRRLIRFFDTYLLQITGD